MREFIQLIMLSYLVTINYINKLNKHIEVLDIMFMICVCCNIKFTSLVLLRG